jgi:hypothetical protein
MGIKRGDLEGLIAHGLQNLRSAESELCERYQNLRNAPWEARVAFLNSLSELDRRVSSLEQLMSWRGNEG